MASFRTAEPARFMGRDVTDYVPLGGALARNPGLWKLYRGLAQRAHGRTGDLGPLLETLDTLTASTLRPYRRSFDGRPPRRIASAMAAALFAQPYLANIWCLGEHSGSFEPGEPPVRLTTPQVPASVEVLEAVLGLAKWELDEIREEVDRTAARHVRRVQLVDWMWGRFDAENDPEALFRLLFPGASQAVGPIDLVRRRGQLYVIIDNPGPAPHALFLSWSITQPSDTAPPMRFRSRYVEADLVRRLVRLTGEDEEEIRQFLDEAITVLPRAHCEEWLVADQWRSRGIGPLAQLGRPYRHSPSLDEPIGREQVEWFHWLTHTPDGLRVQGKARAIFDSLAIERVQASTRHTYAAILALTDQEHSGAVGPSPRDLPLIDVAHHLHRVLTPLISWISSTRSRDRVADELGVDRKTLDSVLEPVSLAWTAQLHRAWIAPPHTHQNSLLGLLLPHLASFAGSMRALLHRPADPRAPHWDTLQLFASFYLRDAPLERLWIRALSDIVVEEGRSSEEDIPGDWFWGLWTRVLDAKEEQTTL